MGKTVIIGAGLAGLGAGYHAQMAGLDYDIYEREDCVGGLCRTIEREGFSFDFAGHLLHLKDPYFQNLVRELLGDNLTVLDRKAYIYSNGVYTRYPFQVNLYGLPADVMKECLLEFVRAYYEHEDLPTDSYKTFHDWIVAKLGRGIGKHFMFPYNEKLWTVPTEELTCEWLSEYVPRPTLEDVFNGTFCDQTKGFGYNATFWYPKKGGIQALCDALAQKIGNLHLNTGVKYIIPEKKAIELETGERVEYEKLISTIPLKTLVSRIKGTIPTKVINSAEGLKHNSAIIVNLGVKGSKLTDKHWIYLPEKQYTPYRVGVYSNFSGHMAPPGTTSYYVEIAYQGGWAINRQSISEKAIDGMIEIGLVPSREDILVQDVQDIPCAYVIYDANYAGNQKVILDYLDSLDISSIGRYGNWEYSGMEEAMQQGRTAAGTMLA